MTKLDPQLLEISDIVSIADNLFLLNDELDLLLNKNYEFITQKDKDGNKIFEISVEAKQSILNIVRYVKKVNDLKEKHYENIKIGKINNNIVSDFKILNNKFNSLIQDYVLSLQLFRENLKLINTLTQKEKDKMDKSLFGDLYDFMSIEDTFINTITMILENKKHISELNFTDYNKTKIELIYSEKRGLSLKSNTKLLYKPRKGTDRFYYLKELINNDGKILSRKHLDKKSKKKKKDNSNQNIVTSHSLSDMNRIIKRKLKLDHDFILGNGYRINTENYKIEINNN